MRRLEAVRILLGEFRDLRDRQDLREDARARSVAVRAWRQGQLREAEEGEVDLEPPIRWEMVSAGSSPLPGCLDLSLVSPDRRPFWEEASGPARLPGARSRTDREARRSRAIERGARTRRGSAETQRTVQRRDGFACQCPDCPHTVWLHSHHLTLYCRGGLSVPSNEVLVCSTCHRNLHRGRLKVTGNPEAGLEWRDGRGLPLGEAPAAVARRARRLGWRLLGKAVG